jgi:hypothetical protein
MSTTTHQEDTMDTITRTIPTAQAEKYGHGHCVKMIERNGYDDSDFCGIFAVPTEGGYRFTWETTGSTRYGGGYVPVADATPEVLEAYKAHRQVQLDRLADEQAAESDRTPFKGKAVTIVRSTCRGKNLVTEGETGTIIWRGEDGYKAQRQDAQGVRYYRVGIQMDDGRKVFTAEENVRVQGHEGEELGKDLGYVHGMIAQSWPWIG